jgi:uncharacterized membrane protein HdeD (DUF308 family)
MLPPTDERVRRHKKTRQPLFFLGITMTLAYVFLGIFLLLDKRTFAGTGLSEELLNIFAVLLIVYGVYRGWRVYKDFAQ